eukprot:CAMPEP_0172332054 /NCGR_PEP_ID=MMETSP1058-20130122/62241_1 /TAXON_ID=83371 /ORGANISM="Detonula confervacea, Strain CCMP 353" /LENGTH=468 /DNA_ID=CAMNT_0013049331 /DNA_START=1091 /DNA_END=2497 /DNA_ORIENTATION=-
MKLCAACCEELPQSSFSKKQWQLKQYQRRCTECIDVNHDVQLEAPSKNASAEFQHPSPTLTADNKSAPCCYICLEEGHDESGQPLRRDCSCRGESAGFAHLSCIAKYAEQKSQDWNGHDTGKFAEPWKTCANCRRHYQNKLALDLAIQFVAFAERQHPGDQMIRLEALHLKLESLEDAIDEKPIAYNIISVIVKSPMLSKSKRVLFIQALAYNGLGRIAAGEMTDGGAKLAVAYFEKARDLSKAIEFAGGVTLAEHNIACVKSRYEGNNSVSREDMLVKSQVLYKQAVELSGQEAIATITAGLNLAVALKASDHGIEAERLLIKLAAMCRQVHGPDHGLTQSAEFNLQDLKARIVASKTQDGWTRFQALRYKEDGEKCVIQGPIAEPRNIQDEKAVAVASDDILVTLGTPVVCHGLKASHHLNGKIGDLRSWDKESQRFEVQFDDKDLKPCLVKQDNIRILFELPSRE